MIDKSWIREPMRIGAIQVSQGDRKLHVPGALNKNGFNVEQLCHLFQDQTIVGIFDKERDGDSLKQYINQSMALGIKIILYINAHCLETNMINMNPDWAQRYADGQCIHICNTFIYTCVNSSWCDYFMGSIKEYLEYEIDGTFLDGPIFYDNIVKNVYTIYQSQHLSSDCLQDGIEFIVPVIHAYERAVVQYDN